MIDTITFIHSISILGSSCTLTINAALNLAHIYQLSDFFVELVNLSILSDLPELVVAITASLDSMAGEDMSGIIVETSIGIVITQIGLVLCFMGLITYITATKRDIYQIGLIKLISTILLVLVGYDLFIEAKDIKIQIKFNPIIVTQYRLVGYENRVLNNEDFNNDKVDRGEIESEHTVTAMYEVFLTENKGWLEPLKYQDSNKSKPYSNELATLKVRYKQPGSDTSRLIIKTISNKQILDTASINYKLTTSVVAFGQLLRGGKILQNYSYNEISQLLTQTLNENQHGYKGEFLQLVSLAKSLSNTQAHHVE